MAIAPNLLTQIKIPCITVNTPAFEYNGIYYTCANYTFANMQDLLNYLPKNNYIAILALENYRNHSIYISYATLNDTCTLTETTETAKVIKDMQEIKKEIKK
jgi:hypothetical protein